MRDYSPSGLALFVLASGLVAGAACSLIYDFQQCEVDEHCGDGQTCSNAGVCIQGSGGGQEIAVAANITEDTIWESENIYRLQQVVHVENGATLTIRAGTKIIGDQGSALIITRGARLEARGTEFEPIVFTSSRDEGMRLPGDWGGVALLGRARANEPNALLEGLTDASRAGYGGTDDSWSCGALEYTRIEFAGFPLEQDKELNGLTLGGCGSGTIVDHVQVHFGEDDGVEVFGGSVNLRHIVITRAQDDSLDWDRGWQGNAQFLAIQQDPEGDNGMECDNWDEDNDADPRSAPRVYNITLIGSNDPAASQRGATYKEGTGGMVRNALFIGHPVESIDIKDPATVTQLQDGGLVIADSLFWQAGEGGEHFFPSLDDELGEEDDDEGFDELSFFTDAALNNRFDLDPEMPNAYDLREPGWIPEADLRGLGVNPPSDGTFFDEAADYFGAFAPGALPWTENWTAYPEN